MPRILVIDDEELVIQTAEKILRREGYDVVAVKTGYDAVEQIKQYNFDLIITDVRMPDLNGVDTLSKIREILNQKGNPRIPEICMTGYADDETISRAKALGVADWLGKPFELKDFLDRIQRILKHHKMEYFSYSQKAFVYKYIVMLSDTDQFKHMSFANYLKLMFLATDALLGPALDSEFLAESRLRLKNSRMQFKKQTVPGDGVLVKVNASEINTSAFALLYTFMVEGTAELVGLGRQVYESVNLKTGLPQSLSIKIGEILAPIDVDEKQLLYKY